ncbi:hypothetical protein GCM10007063_30720 [Lentibacillus kapialis]|uniref:Lipoprotein n=1 Tax=Lentibacillus kapialis TaxID=340214 RepID=A0A917Q1Y5_9BACI|nr:hypothetical protein [Lentibacillus kapialis]GGK06098.1 hypothetical protein GCM10007063_30720 [Lentibacillus kapialis]
MKKKATFLSIFVLLFALLSACTNNTGALIKPNENSMVIHIKNNSNIDFYSIEISTGGDIIGGISNADGSEIRKGDTLSKKYTDQGDFNLEGKKTFKFALLNEMEQKVPLKEITLELATNKEYSFEITGDSINEAGLKRIN